MKQKKFHKQPFELIKEARELLQEGLVTDAVRLLNCSIEIYPKNGWIRANLGIGYLLEGEHDVALDMFLKAQTFVPRPVPMIERAVSVLSSEHVDLDGVRLRVPKCLVSPPILRYLIEGGYENKERQALERIVRPSDRVLELGAGLGYLACCIGRGFPQIPYMAVEANPDLLPLIRENFVLNDCHAELIHGAASPHSGTLKFNIAEDFWASSLGEVPGQEQVVEVPSIKIDSLLADFCPTVVVMDIEGGELEIAETTQWPGVEHLVLELHPDIYGYTGSTKVVRSLFEAGFLLDASRSGSQVFLFCREDANSEEPQREKHYGTLRAK